LAGVVDIDYVVLESLAHLAFIQPKVLLAVAVTASMLLLSMAFSALVAAASVALVIALLQMQKLPRQKLDSA
jgi:hypothetical protein